MFWLQKKPKGYSKPKTQASRNQQQLSNRGKQSEVNEADEKTVKLVSVKNWIFNTSLNLLLPTIQLTHNKTKQSKQIDKEQNKFHKEIGLGQAPHWLSNTLLHSSSLN
mgnify:CR=1 FL=1